MDHGFARLWADRIDPGDMQGRLAVVDAALGSDGDEHVVVEARDVARPHPDPHADHGPGRRGQERLAGDRCKGIADPGIRDLGHAQDLGGIGAPCSLDIGVIHRGHRHSPSVWRGP